MIFFYKGRMLLCVLMVVAILSDAMEKTDAMEKKLPDKTGAELVKEYSSCLNNCIKRYSVNSHESYGRETSTKKDLKKVQNQDMCAHKCFAHYLMATQQNTQK